MGAKCKRLHFEINAFCVEAYIVMMASCPLIKVNARSDDDNSIIMLELNMRITKNVLNKIYNRLPQTNWFAAKTRAIIIRLPIYTKVHKHCTIPDIDAWRDACQLHHNAYWGFYIRLFFYYSSPISCISRWQMSFHSIPGSDGIKNKNCINILIMWRAREDAVGPKSQRRLYTIYSRWSPKRLAMEWMLWKSPWSVYIVCERGIAPWMIRWLHVIFGLTSAVKPTIASVERDSNVTIRDDM